MPVSSRTPWNSTVEQIFNELIGLRARANSQPDIAAWIEGKLRTVDDMAARIFLMSELAGEYDERGEYDKSERVLQERIRISGGAAQSWISLAEHYHYASRDLTAARETIEKAIQSALAEGAFIRQAAGIRVRIALALGDYQCVEETLRLLLTDEARTSHPDVAYETDFLSRIPGDLIDREVIGRYRLSVGRAESRGQS